MLSRFCVGDYLVRTGLIFSEILSFSFYNKRQELIGFRPVLTNAFSFERTYVLMGIAYRPHDIYNDRNKDLKTLSRMGTSENGAQVEETKAFKNADVIHIMRACANDIAYQC